MKVAGFMVPADKVIAVTPTDTVRKVMDLMLVNKIGALVVLEQVAPRNLDDQSEVKLPIPVGIITKSDIMTAYQNMVKLDDPCSKIMFKGELQTCTVDMSRDRAARILESTHNHHLIVVDPAHKEFLGLMSSWDITSECAKDDRAWPFLRSEDGKFHGSPSMQKRVEKRASSPQHAEDHPTIAHHEHDEFTTYMDDLDLLAFQ